MKIIFLVTRP